MQGSRCLECSGIVWEYVNVDGALPMERNPDRIGDATGSQGQGIDRPSKPGPSTTGMVISTHDAFRNQQFALFGP